MKINGNQNFDLYNNLDGEHSSFKVPAHEERSARVNEGTFTIGGAALASTQHSYELQGRHSVLSRHDVETEQIMWSQDIANPKKHL